MSLGAVPIAALLRARDTRRRGVPSAARIAVVFTWRHRFT
jgi:hypothetical protein